MTDELKPEEIDALIRALENGGWPYATHPTPRLERLWVFSSSAQWDYVLSDVGRLLAQSLKREREGMAWRPIETAPKDGTTVLVYVPGETLYPTAASYDSREYFAKEYGDPEYMPEGWRWENGYPGDFHEEVIDPTHWLPLPSPPESERSDHPMIHEADYGD